MQEPLLSRRYAGLLLRRRGNAVLLELQETRENAHLLVELLQSFRDARL